MAPKKSDVAPKKSDVDPKILYREAVETADYGQERQESDFPTQSTSNHLNLSFAEHANTTTKV